MPSVNKVILLGNVGRDPEVRYLPSGVAVCDVSLATSSRRKDRNTGETIEETQWHRLKFIDRLAEVAGEYVKKGRPIYVEGRLRYGKYTGSDGVERNTTDVIVTELQLLGGRDDQAGGQAPAQAPAQRAAAPARAPAPARPDRPPVQGGGSGFDDMDDDIPFASPHADHDPIVADRKARRLKVAR